MPEPLSSSRSNDTITAAHERLAALLHATIASDPQSSPDGFRDARELGLIEGAGHTTAAGRAVLLLLGARD